MSIALVFIQIVYYWDIHMYSCKSACTRFSNYHLDSLISSHDYRIYLVRHDFPIKMDFCIYLFIFPWCSSGHHKWSTDSSFVCNFCYVVLLPIISITRNIFNFLWSIQSSAAFLFTPEILTIPKADNFGHYKIKIVSSVFNTERFWFHN